MRKSNVVFFVSVMLLVSMMVFAGGSKEPVQKTDTPVVEAALPYEGAVLHFAVAAEQFADHLKVFSKEFMEKTG